MTLFSCSADEGRPAKLPHYVGSCGSVLATVGCVLSSAAEAYYEWTGCTTVAQRQDGTPNLLCDVLRVAQRTQQETWPDVLRTDDGRSRIASHLSANLHAPQPWPFMQ